MVERASMQLPEMLMVTKFSSLASNNFNLVSPFIEYAVISMLLVYGHDIYSGAPE